jgi:pseudaminic acid biosynthesis-associated methylase
MIGHNNFTEQELFWSGEFGDGYIDRNRDQALLASNIVFFSKALHRSGSINSILELGANIGMNMLALQCLLPKAELSGVEINAQAADKLRTVIPPENVIEGSIFDVKLDKTHDLVFTKGVLIHLAPEKLAEAYSVLARQSDRYVLIGEYYNPVPVCIDYRGHQNKLFKRDFCGEFLAQHSEYRLIDYGFSYRGDVTHPQDDITWFLLEK